MLHGIRTSAENSHNGYERLAIVTAADSLCGISIFSGEPFHMDGENKNTFKEWT